MNIHIKEVIEIPDHGVVLACLKSGSYSLYTAFL